MYRTWPTILQRIAVSPFVVHTMKIQRMLYGSGDALQSPTMKSHEHSTPTPMMSS